jgi:hypothetical protein
VADPVSSAQSVADPTAPEELVCPGCGLKITASWGPPTILSIGHPIPGCAAFSAIVDVDDYLTAARASAAHEVKDV